MPLRAGEITVGVLFVSVPPPHPITPEQVRLLESLAEMAGAALHRMSLYEETVRQLDQLAGPAQHRPGHQRQHGPAHDAQRPAGARRHPTAGGRRQRAPAQPAHETLEHAAGRGFRTRRSEERRIRLGESLAGRAALERRRPSTRTSAQIQAEPQLAALRAGGGLRRLLCRAAHRQRAGQRRAGGFHRTPLAAGPDWLSLLETLAGQAAIAIDNAQLFDDLQRSNIDLTLAYDATIEGWSRALDLRDKETEGHTQRVTEMTVRLARAMGIADAELVHIRRGALLHDIGKMGVPDSILLKPGPLTDEEWVIMRQHPQLAYDMLSPIAYLRPALDIPYCHHEKWDGTGYPRG